MDASLFQMQVEQSGLSGVSAEAWIDQRYRDVYKDVSSTRVNCGQTVNRFLKEADWLRKNAGAHETNKWLNAGSAVLSGLSGAISAYDSSIGRRGR